jgi:Tannase and feruloyl esterase
MQANNNKYPGLVVLLLLLSSCAGTHRPPPESTAFDEDEIKACRDLRLLPDLTIIYADVSERHMGVPAHCYVRGLISGSITWHAQLPARSQWTGRLVHLGDGGSDGELDYKPDPYTRSWVAEGDAVVNSNSGHDSGTGPNWAYENRQAEIDFGYRAVHLTVNAGKTLVAAYYGRAADRSYHVGCSNGGRQGLVAAQRFPQDFDGIVAGAPSIYRVENFYHHLKLMQELFADGLAANLAVDTDGDGLPDSLAKIDRLHEAVISQCDAHDGVVDGVIDYPRACDFDVDGFLQQNRCTEHASDNTCFTDAQADFVRHLYAGSKDAQGRLIYGGLQPGSEATWYRYTATADNRLVPYVLQSLLRTFQTVFDTDPGVVAADSAGIRQTADRAASTHEWAWRSQDPEIVLSETGELQSIMDARDPDLRDYLVGHGGKLLIYQGWNEPFHSADRLIDYYNQLLRTTFAGTDAGADGASSVRLFMLPGVQHCILGSGPDRWNSYQVVKDWVEKGQVPERIVVQHQTWDVVDNERPVCAYPERTVYVGPEGGINDRANWVAANFRCLP